MNILLPVLMLGCALAPPDTTLVADSCAVDSCVTLDDHIIISNDTITLMQDLSRGGCICYISKADTLRNLINVADEGRYVQQSYYAGHRIDRQSEGQSPRWSPWQWNPIQCGNFAGKQARILDYAFNDTMTYVKCVPMLWDMPDHEADATMEQWTVLEGNIIKVKNRLSVYSIPEQYKADCKNTQEIPAVYPISSLKNLYTYYGLKLFKGKKLKKLPVQELNPEKGTFWGDYPNVPENWMAFVDDSNFGIAVYNPKARGFLAGRYKSDTDGEELSSATSYIAPLCSEVITDNTIYEYDYYLIVDYLDNIRQTVINLFNRDPYNRKIKKWFMW